MKIEKDFAIAADRVPIDGDVNRFAKIAFAYCSEEARLISTGSSDIEQNKNCRQVSTIMRALLSKDGDLLSHFDKNDESQAENNNISLKQHLPNNHNVAAKKLKDNYH